MKMINSSYSHIEAMAAIAKAEARIYASLIAIDLGVQVQLKSAFHGSYISLRSDVDGRDWCRSVLVCEVVKGIVKTYGIDAAETLCQWLSAHSSDEVHRSSQSVVEHAKREVDYRQSFIASFDRDAKAKAYMDEMTPVGPVHYRILYTYNTCTRTYTTQRIKATDQSQTFWNDNSLWFDYYGPAEDMNGLIAYIDY